MTDVVMYVLGTSAGTTYQFALDANNPVAASAIPLNTAALAAVESADLDALKAENPGWVGAASSSKWVGGIDAGAYYMVVARLYEVDFFNQRYKVRLVLVGTDAATSLAVFSGEANSTSTGIPDPVPYAFDGSALYARVAVSGPYVSDQHPLGVLTLQTTGVTTIQSLALGTSKPDACVVVKVGTETLLATEFIDREPT